MPSSLGQPHRLRPLRQALEHIAWHRDPPGVDFTTAGATVVYVAGQAF